MMFSILKYIITGVGALAIQQLAKKFFGSKEEFKQKKAALKKKNLTKEQFTIQKKKLEQQYIDRVINDCNVTNDLSKQIGDKQGKQHICFLGPTSVGKSTLCNQLFSTKQKTGLGSTTTQAIVVKQTSQKVYYDARGTNSDWQDYEFKDIAFFTQLDRVFILYDRDIKDIRFLSRLLNQMKLKLIFVRTKCDLWDKDMDSIDSVLQKDSNQLRKQGINFEIVIRSGKGMNSEIKKYI